MMRRTHAGDASASELAGDGVWGRSPQGVTAFAEKRAPQWSGR
jgi:hypothetical protein